MVIVVAVVVKTGGLTIVAVAVVNDSVTDDGSSFRSSRVVSAP